MDNHDQRDVNRVLLMTQPDEVNGGYEITHSQNHPTTNGVYAYNIVGTHTPNPNYGSPPYTDYIADIIFQCGNPAEVGHNGVLSIHLLEILRHHLSSFYDGQFGGDDETLNAINHLKGAIECLNKRAEARRNKGIQGKQVK